MTYIFCDLVFVSYRKIKIIILSGVSLMTDNLLKIPMLIKLGRKCRRVVMQNIGGAIMLKLVFVGVALAGKIT